MHETCLDVLLSAGGRQCILGSQPFAFLLLSDICLAIIFRLCYVVSLSQRNRSNKTRTAAIQTMASTIENEVGPVEVHTPDNAVVEYVLRHTMEGP